MKIISYKELQKDFDFDLYKRADEIVLRGLPEVLKAERLTKEEFEKSSGILSIQIAFLIKAAGSLEGKTILDLACGSNQFGGDNMTWQDREYEPWLGRILSAAGYKIIGVDCGPNQPTNFPIYKRSLLSANALSDIPDSSIDIINVCNLFDAPSMYKQITRTPIKGGLLQHLINISTPKAKPDGIFIYQQ